MSRDATREQVEDAAEGSRFDADDFAVQERRDGSRVAPTDDAVDRVAREQLEELQDELPEDEALFLTEDAEPVIQSAADAQETITGQQSLQEATDERVDLQSPTDVIEALPADEDVEIEVRDGVTTTIRADDVEAAQEGLETRREQFEADPAAFADDLDTDTLETAGRLEQSAEQARARRRATREAAADLREDVADEVDGLDPDDVELDVDPDRGRVAVADDMTVETEREVDEGTTEEEAREELAAEIDGVEEDDIIRVSDDQLAVDPRVEEQILQERAVEQLDEQVEDRDVTRDDVEFDGLEARLEVEPEETPQPAIPEIDALEAQRSDERTAQQVEQREDLRADAAEEFDVDADEVSVEFDGDRLRALGPEEAVEAGDRTILARGEDFPDDLGDALELRPGEGDQVFETDLPTSQREAASDVRSFGETLAAGAFAPAAAASDAGSAFLEELDVDTEDVLGAAGAGVATPEPATTAAGAAVGAAVGLGALQDRTEVDVPERREAVERPEITAPVDESVTQAELEVGENDFERAEVETPTDGEAVTAEVEVPDETVTGEVGVPDIEARQVAVTEERLVDEEMIEDERQVTIGREGLEGFDEFGELPEDERLGQIRDQLERQQEFVREDTEFEQPRDAGGVTFPAEQASEPAVEAAEVAEVSPVESAAFDVATAPPAQEPAAGPVEFEDFDTQTAPAEAGFADATPRVDAVETGSVEAAMGERTAQAQATDVMADFEASPVEAATTTEPVAAQQATAEPVEDVFAEPTLTDVASPAPPSPGTGTTAGPPRLPRPDVEFDSDEFDRSFDEEYEVLDDEFVAELDDPDFLGGG